MHDIWNPWHGCHKCSPGCERCYMYHLDAKRGIDDSNVVKLTNNLYYPLKKDKQGNYKIRSGERIRVNMTSDTFIEEADAWRSEMWSAIKQRPDVCFWLITKRPERIEYSLPNDWCDGYENVMISITCENQDMYDKRWPVFSQIKAKHKSLCLAPLLSDINISSALSSGQIEIVECGGENYGNPRECNFEWIQHIADICRKHRINFCLYETGTNLIYNNKKYYIPKKADQAFYAYVMNVNQVYYPLNFNLKTPDGKPIKEYIKQYNLYHCVFCANRMVCNGCSNCGNCGRVSMTDINGIHNQEQKLWSSLSTQS